MLFHMSLAAGFVNKGHTTRLLQIMSASNEEVVVDCVVAFDTDFLRPRMLDYLG